MTEVTTAQLSLLVASIAAFAAGLAASVARAWRARSAGPSSGEREAREHNGLRLAAKACWYAGVLLGLGVLLWHAADRGDWLPLGDNFDALIWLGLLLALFVLYVQRTRPLGGLDWFVMPIVVLLLAAAGVFGRFEPHDYVGSAWAWAHRLGAYGGAAAFFIAGASGAMYLVASRRLRRKGPPIRAAGPAGFASLERLENLTFAAVTLGFALFTLGAVTGLVQMLQQGKHTPAAKLALAFSAWVVYAIVLHSPINPSFRGRKTAVLSVIGLLLMVGTIVAVQLM